MNHIHFFSILFIHEKLKLTYYPGGVRGGRKEIMNGENESLFLWPRLEIIHLKYSKQNLIEYNIKQKN